MKEGEPTHEFDQQTAKTLDAKQFAKTLEHFGLTEIQTDRRGDDVRTRGRIEGGLHDVIVTFPEINPSDKRYMYGNNDRDMRSIPLKVEIGSEHFRKLVQQLSSPDIKKATVRSAINKLDVVIQRTLKSSEEDERIASTDDILKKGKTACAGKTLLAGLVLSEVRPDLIIQRITGASSQSEGKLRHSIGHEWLRVVDPKRNEVVLYDPYYQRVSSYNMLRPETSDRDSFATYDVDAIALSQLDHMVGIEGFNRHDMKTVQYPGVEAASLRVATSIALGAQIRGELGGLMKLKAGVIEFINGSLEVSFDPTKKESSSRSLYPLRRIQKVQSRS